MPDVRLIQDLILQYKLKLKVWFKENKIKELSKEIFQRVDQEVQIDSVKSSIHSLERLHIGFITVMMETGLVGGTIFVNLKVSDII